MNTADHSPACLRVSFLHQAIAPNKQFPSRSCHSVRRSVAATGEAAVREEAIREASNFSKVT